MKTNIIEKFSQTVIEAFQQCWRRFTITVGFVVALTAYITYALTADESPEKDLNIISIYYLSVGALLSLSLHLWGEETSNALKRKRVQLVAHGLLIADTLLLYNNLETGTAGIETGIAHAAAIFAIWLSIFHLSFLKEKNDVASWNFTIATIASYIRSLFIGMVLCGGIHMLLFSMDQLFGIEIAREAYTCIFCLCCILLNNMIFLGQLPKKESKHDYTPYSTGFGKSILRYIFLPLTGGYLAVLYVYAARVLVTWELPSGWVSWLVIALMVLCLVIQFGLYPARICDNKPSDNAIARWLPAMILPLLVLMTIGIVRRFSDYGVTVSRLYIAALNAWFYVVCLGLFLSRARRIHWIPLSFAGLFLLTSVLPVNFCSLTKSYILSDVNKEIERQAPSLPMTELQYLEWLTSMPSDTAQSIKAKLVYMNDFFGSKSIEHLVDENITYRLSDIWSEETSDYMIITSLSSFSDKEQMLEVPQGCTQLIRIPCNGYKYLTRHLPHEYLQQDILPVEVFSTGNKRDSVYFNMLILTHLANTYTRDDMPHVTFDCNSKNTIFVLTGFQLSYSQEIKHSTDSATQGAQHRQKKRITQSIHGDIDFDFNGYLIRLDSPQQ